MTFLVLFVLGCIQDKEESSVLPYLGTWEGQTELEGVPVIMQMTIAAAQTFNTSLSVIGSVDTITVLTWAGSWVDLGNNLLELSYSQCGEFDGTNLLVIVCQRSLDSINVSIQGNVWIYADDNGQTINLVKQ